MTTRADVIAIFEQQPAALRFLEKTLPELEAMSDADFKFYAARAGQFLREAGELQMRAAKILEDYKKAMGPCLASDLAHRAQKLRDLQEEFGHVQRVLREKYFMEGA